MKRFVWFIALLPLVGALLFFVRNPEISRTESGGDKLEAQKLPTPGLRSENRTNPDTSQGAGRPRFDKEKVDLAITKIQESKQRLQTEVGRLPAAVEKALIDGKMKFREPQLRSALQSWGVDSVVAANAMKIIREREVALWESMKRRALQGSPSAQAGAEDKEIEGAIAEGQLVSLLGKERARELMLLDAKLVSEQESKRRGPE